MPHAAGQTVGVGAGSPYGGHDQVPFTEALDDGSDLDDLGQSLVPNDQVVLSIRRGAVFERADLFVGAADPDLQDAEENVVRLGDARHRVVDKPDLSWPG